MEGRRSVTAGLGWIAGGPPAPALRRGGAGAGDAAGGAPRTARLEITAFEVAPGEEGLFCQDFANPFDDDVDVARWTADLTKGGHHALVFAVDGGGPVALAPCGGSDFT